jgi:hypothetical protein
MTTGAATQIGNKCAVGYYATDYEAHNQSSKGIVLYSLDKEQLENAGGGGEAINRYKRLLQKAAIGHCFHINRDGMPGSAWPPTVLV